MGEGAPWPGLGSGGLGELTLWTMQPPDIWAQLRAGRTVRAEVDRCHAAAGPEGLGARRVAAYEWIAAQLARRDPRPPGVRWPLWAWWCIGEDGPVRPDLRRYRQSEPGVMLELRVAARRVLLSDLDGWHNVLNDEFNGRGLTWYWEEKAAAAGDAARLRWLERRKRHSWRRCLAVHPARPTQAVLWEIRPEDVKRGWKFQGFVQG
ncbi:DUF3841 domain-containing protein [Buchananella hordeovulneris]|uniref:DUF3841 domain-containing protein n=1 Tax=Buchananella hordeovulneris TaxID=52770 RepID=UPI000F5FAFD3|nr:DUF3841 domain-containing protein [Buchananella hordeovulneris]RRD44948.1 DUF3841 domain-containing protein [Buchananella hordeovulneris]